MRLASLFTWGTLWVPLLVVVLLFFAIPVIIGNLLQELYNVVDTLIVGQTLGEIKLAAVGSTSSLNFFALGFFIGLSAGCSVITSQHFGANDMERVKKSVAAHIIIGVVSAVVLTVSFDFDSVRQRQEIFNSPVAAA